MSLRTKHVSAVPRVIHLQRVLRRWARLVCAVTLVALAAPAALGASLGPILRESRAPLNSR